MTVSEMIKELQQCPPDATVKRDADGVEITEVFSWPKDLEVFIS